MNQHAIALAAGGLSVALSLRALLDDVQPSPTRLERGWVAAPVVVAVGCALLALLA